MKKLKKFMFFGLEKEAGLCEAHRVSVLTQWSEPSVRKRRRQLVDSYVGPSALHGQRVCFALDYSVLNKRAY